MTRPQLVYCKQCGLLSIRDTSRISNNQVFTKHRKDKGEVVTETVYYQSSVVMGELGTLETGIFGCNHEKEIDCEIQSEYMPGTLEKCNGCKAHYKCLFLVTDKEWRMLVG